MELRLLEIVIRLLDPRKWRLRLLQAGGALFATLWVWGRSVDQAPVHRAVRDARRAERAARIREHNAQLEQRHLRAHLD